MWRKRWFVLKDGFLFRFTDPSSAASPQTKPRGILSLHTCTDVTDALRETGVTGAGVTVTVSK